MRRAFAPSLRRACALLASGGLLSGCVLPLPEYGDGSTPYLSSDAIGTLVVGKTTRAEVVMQFGQPDLRRDGDRFIDYYWDVVVGWWGLGHGAAGDIRRTRMLCLEFGDEGVLVKKQFINPGILRWRRIECRAADAGAGGGPGAP